MKKQLYQRTAMLLLCIWEGVTEKASSRSTTPFTESFLSILSMKFKERDTARFSARHPISAGQKCQSHFSSPQGHWDYHLKPKIISTEPPQHHHIKPVQDLDQSNQTPVQGMPTDVSSGIINYFARFSCLLLIKWTEMEVTQLQARNKHEYSLIKYGLASIECWSLNWFCRTTASVTKIQGEMKSSIYFWRTVIQ